MLADYVLGVAGHGPGVTNMWHHRTEVTSSGGELVAYDVAAADGRIGELDGSSVEAGRAFLVVDTGPWIFGKKRMIPVGVVDGIDLDRPAQPAADAAPGAHPGWVPAVDLARSMIAGCPRGARRTVEGVLPLLDVAPTRFEGRLATVTEMPSPPEQSEPVGSAHRCRHPHGERSVRSQR